MVGSGVTTLFTHYQYTTYLHNYMSKIKTLKCHNSHS